MADESQQPQRLDLQYRAAREDLRPAREDDLFWAVVFACIALGLLGVIVYLVQSYRLGGIAAGLLLVPVGLLAGARSLQFAAG